MSLDQLISRYLDGELSTREDIKLRNLLKENREAKKEFDSAVLLNAALREDARSISTPEELCRDTEDLIMMEIMKDYEAPVVIKQKKRRKIAWAELFETRSLRPAFSFVFAVAAISGIFAISDISDYSSSNIDTALNNNVNISVPAKQATVNGNSTLAGKVLRASKLSGGSAIIDGRNVAQANAAGSEEFAALGKASSANNKPAQPLQGDKPANIENGNASNDGFSGSIVPPVSAPSDINASESNNINNTININNSTLASAKESSAIPNTPVTDPKEKSNDAATLPQGSNDIALRANSNLLSPINTDKLVLNNDPEKDFHWTAKLPPADFNFNGIVKSIASFDQVFNNDEVQFNTFFGSDLIANGLSKSKNKGVNHFSQSVSYSLSQRSRLGLEFGITEYNFQKNSIISLSGSGNTQMKTEGFDPVTGDKMNIVVPVKINQTGQMMWGALIYENNLYSDEWAELTAHGGIGFTGSGPIGYLRLYGKLNLFSGLSLTLGTEAREYSLIINNSKSKYKFSNLLMYGIQFKL